jgi:hypothetical protein
MAICHFCDREMATADSCAVKVLHRNGVAFPLPTATRSWSPNGRCGDCNVRVGKHHHLGCDIQRCPACRGQMLSCGCRFDEDPPDLFDEDHEDDEDDEDAPW